MMKKIIKRIAVLAGIVLAVVLVGFLVVLPHFRARSRQTLCLSKLASMSQVLAMYALDHEGALPSNMAEIAGAYVHPGFLTCPHHWATNRDPAKVDQWMDYYYVYWPDGTNTPTQYPLMYDRCLANHDGRGINVLLVNGTHHRKGSPGTVFWDDDATWLRRFAREHPSLSIWLPEEIPQHEEGQPEN